MAIQVTTKLITEDYIPVIEREELSPATFTLKPLNGAEYLDVMCHMIDDDEGGQRLSRQGIEKIFKYGVKEVNNLLDSDNKPLTKVKPEMLSPILLSEIASRIMAISEVTEQERKNS